MVSTLDKKQTVTRRIRAAFQDGLKTSSPSSVKEFVDGFIKEYGKLSPETLAFVIQKVNSFQLFKEFRDAGGKQVYPVIDLIDVRRFCKQYGYKNIYDTIRANMMARKGSMSKKSSYDQRLTEYSQLTKIASKDSRVRDNMSTDTKIDSFKKFASSKLYYDLKDRTDDYWNLRGIEGFIKQAKLDTRTDLKEILDAIRSNKVVGSFSKRASLTDFLAFKKSIEKLASDAKKVQ